MSYIERNINGESWLTLGDSITERGWYQPEVARILGIQKWENHGIGGTCIAQKNKNDNLAMCLRYKNMKTGVGIITIWGGVNDFGYDFGSCGGVEIGDSKSDSTLTFIGAMKALLTGISMRHPLARTGFIITTPISEKRGMNKKNNKGYYLSDYCSVCRELCEKYSIPYLDLQKNSGFNEFNIGIMTSNSLCTDSDGLHPSKEGVKRIAPKISEFILSI